LGENGINPQVKAFLADHIDSVLELELLLLLRAHAPQAWTPAALAAELKIDSTWAAAQLATFASRGLLVRTGADPAGSATTAGAAPPSGSADGGYRYEPETPQLDAAVAAVADAYASHRVTIIGLIFSKPTSTLKSFADAFRIRKDKPDA
jgi:hypothetical protein